MISAIYKNQIENSQSLMLIIMLEFKINSIMNELFQKNVCDLSKCPTMLTI